GESVVEIAGLVRPGRTPCTVCSCLHRKDADSGWFDQYPRLRALSDRESLTDPLARILGAGHAVQLLRHCLLRPRFAPVRPVRSGESVVEIAGLVRPGRTPCTVCSCLHRKDADSGWFDPYPRLRALSDRESLTDPLARILGAGHAVQLLRHCLLRPRFDPVRRV